VIGLGAEVRMANTERARAICPGSAACAAIAGAGGGARVETKITLRLVAMSISTTGGGVEVERVFGDV
jgi:hypothetical protein